MSAVLSVILSVVFAAAQFLCAQKAAHKVKKYIPMLISAVGVVFAVGLYVYTLIIYGMGAVSESVLAENQYFAAFILIHAGMCLIGAAVGFLIGFNKEGDRVKKKFIAAVVLAAAFLAGTGFQKRTDVVLRDYSVPEDETAIRLVVQPASSMGYIRGFKDEGGGARLHYLIFLQHIRRA